jgi:hypothetical protein
MKQGKYDIQEWATELKRQNEAKRDFVADSRKVLMAPDTGNLEVDLTTSDTDLQRVEEFGVTPHAHSQLSQVTKIPKPYYDRMPTDLRAINVNHWLKNEPKTHMLRILDDDCRAVVSSRYRPLDNWDLANAIIPVLQEQEDMQIISCDITPTRMYLKALFPKIEGELAVGDIVQAGLTIQNSEVGNGALAAMALAYRLWCLNGCSSEVGMRRNHVGRATGGEGEAAEFFSDATREKDDEAFWLKTQDIVRATVDQAKFEKIVANMRATKETGSLGDPIAVIEKTVKRFNLTEGEGSGILEHLVQGGDLSGFGLLNAVTRYSQDIEDYDRATDFEKLGGQIIELDPKDWQTLASPTVQVQGADVVAA